MEATNRDTHTHHHECTTANASNISMSMIQVY